MPGGTTTGGSGRSSSRGKPVGLRFEMPLASGDLDPGVPAGSPNVTSGGGAQSLCLPGSSTAH